MSPHLAKAILLSPPYVHQPEAKMTGRDRAWSARSQSCDLISAVMLGACLFSTDDWIHGFTHVQHTLYHWAPPPAQRIYFNRFGVQFSIYKCLNLWHKIIRMQVAEKVNSNHREWRLPTGHTLNEPQNYSLGIQLASSPLACLLSLRLSIPSSSLVSHSLQISFFLCFVLFHPNLCICFLFKFPYHETKVYFNCNSLFNKAFQAPL